MDWYIKSFAVDRIEVWMKGRKSNAFREFWRQPASRLLKAVVESK